MVFERDFLALFSVVILPITYTECQGDSILTERLVFAVADNGFRRQRVFVPYNISKQKWYIILVQSIG